MPGDLNLQCGTSPLLDKDTKTLVFFNDASRQHNYWYCRLHIQVVKNFSPLKKRELQSTLTNMCQSWKLLYQELEWNSLQHKRNNSAPQVTKQDKTHNTLLCAVLYFSSVKKIEAMVKARWWYTVKINDYEQNCVTSIIKKKCYLKNKQFYGSCKGFTHISVKECSIWQKRVKQNHYLFLKSLWKREIFIFIFLNVVQWEQGHVIFCRCRLDHFSVKRIQL